MVTQIIEPPGPAEQVKAASRISEFVNSLLLARSITPQSRNLRPLRPDEIEVLKTQHNAAENWATVWVSPNFNPHKVVGSYFSGTCLLGSFSGQVQIEPGVTIGSGIYNCDLQNVVVGDNAYLANNDLIANYVIGSGAIVRGCGSVACTGETTFGNRQQLKLALESPGRETGIYAEITVRIAAQVTGQRGSREMQQAYQAALEEYYKRVASKVGVIEAGASVKNTPKVLNVYVGTHAMLDSAAWLENVTVLSAADQVTQITSGAIVKDSIVQWGARVDSHAIVQNSVCCEHSAVDSHAKVWHSLLGPSTIVGFGECLHSLVGPFVGLHHQCLLIAAYWPQGKGNIGYGASIGSNHTSKAPDQEIWPGEGMFFGLGVNVKFPADFSKSPYSIIATGVTTLPQRVEMPFSLINVRAESIEGVSPAYNEILPGWVLSDNIYAVRRNERKYAMRNKARRNVCGFEVFRPEVVDLMVKARASLRKVVTEQTATVTDQVKQPAVLDDTLRPVYTDKQIPGLGKNYLKETARLEGIEAYTFYIRLYALKGLYFAIRFCQKQERPINGVLQKGYIVDKRYEHELALLLSEFPGKSVGDLLTELVKAHERMAADTLLSKEKDNFRGVRVIPDYQEVHFPAKEDPFVKAVFEETETLKQEVEQMLKLL